MQCADKDAAANKADINDVAILPVRTAAYSGDGSSFAPSFRPTNSGRRVQPSAKFVFHVIKTGKDVTLQIKKGNDGGSVRLDVYYNASAGIAYAQLFDFRNYTYEPVTAIIELPSPKADKLISQL